MHQTQLANTKYKKYKYKTMFTLIEFPNLGSITANLSSASFFRVFLIRRLRESSTEPSFIATAAARASAESLNLWNPARVTLRAKIIY